MISFGLPEILVILLLVLLSFDIKQIAKIMQWLRNMRTKFFRMQTDLKYQFNSLLAEEERKEKEITLIEKSKKWRSWGRNVVKALPEQQKTEAEQAFLAQIKKSGVLKDAKVVAAYYHLPDELPTQSILQHILDQGLTLLLPYIEGEWMHFSQIQNLSDDLETGAFDIKEPKLSLRKQPHPDPDIFIIPGRCFDDQGGRIGRGKGYYDKFLAEGHAKRVGVCFDCQVAKESLSQQSHDQSMDILITEKRIIEIDHKTSYDTYG